MYYHTMDLPHRLDNVITCLRDNNFTIPTLIRSVLESSSNSHYACQESLLFGATDICSDLFRALESKDSKTISSWVFDVVTKKLCREVTELARKENGLHFNASNTTAEYLEGSFMVNASQKIKKVAPDLWVLLYDLLDANPLRRRTMPTKNDAEIIEGLAADAEGDLGEIGEDVRDDDTNMNEDLEDDVPGDEQQSRAKKRRIRAATRNSALLTIVCERSK
jgi:hypothetical protein